MSAHAERRFKTARPVAHLRQGRNDWYRITNRADGATDVAIYDEIGYWGVTAQDFIAELKAIDAAEISLRINSPGGEIFDGIAIMNCLRSHTAKVTTYVDSLAASIASVIAMAGDRIIMQPHSQLMIHDGSGLCIGNAADMRQLADLLDRQSDNIAAIYAERAGGTPAEWRERMRTETWYSAEEAVEAGLADEVAKPKRRGDDDDDPGMGNSWDLSIFRYQGRGEAPDPDARPAAPATDPEPEPEPAATDPAGDDPAPAVDPVPDEPNDLAGSDAAAETPEPGGPDEPADEWAAVTAHLTETPAESDPDDVFAALTEAL